MADIGTLIKTKKAYDKGLKTLKKVGGEANARKMLANKLKKKKKTAAQ